MFTSFFSKPQIINRNIAKLLCTFRFSVSCLSVVIASGIADGDNAADFACRPAGVSIVGGGGMIDSTPGIEGDVSVKGASAVGNTVVIVSGDAGGVNDAAFASRAAGVDTDFCNATCDDERLSFCPIS